MADAPVDIPDRHSQVLSAIIELFIESAQPVGSRTVSKEMAQEWSPATIRNVMADLEESGLLDQPHLSAGRVPTTRALRYWIQRVVQPRRPAAAVQRQLRTVVSGEADPKARLSRLTGALSDLVHGAGIALAPSLGQGRLARAELVPVGERRVLFLWVTRRGVVYHRALDLNERVTPELVANLERILNQEYVGHTFEELRSEIRADLREMKARYDVILDTLLAISRLSPDDVIVEGVQRVSELPDFADIGVLRQLFQAFEDRHELAAMLDRISRHGGLQVLLNEESGLAAPGLGLVAAPYAASDHVLGSIGVVGPTRMPYPTVLGLVEFASHLISESFSAGEDAAAPDPAANEPTAK